MADPIDDEAGDAAEEPLDTDPRFDTLPPVGTFSYSTAPGDVIAQVTVDGGGPVTVPLLTVYGDGRVITAVDGSWLDGTVLDFELQEFFEEVRSVGLLRNELILRGPEDDEIPDIRVDLAVDGRVLAHQLDLFRIERPTEPRAFLQRAATDNYFELTEPFTPAGGWLVCRDDAPCSVEAAQVTPEDRPVLPHEDVAALASEAGIGDT